MKGPLTLFIPFAVAALIYLPPLRRFGFLIASVASSAMALLEGGEGLWIWAFFALAFLLGWFVEVSPLISFWAVLSLGLANASLFWGHSPLGAFFISSSLLLMVPALWEELAPDFAGISVFLLLAMVPFLTFNAPEEWRFPLVLVSLLGVFPLHLWVRSAMKRVASFGALLLVTGFRAIVLFWLGRESVMLSYEALRMALTWLGFISIVWGAFRALVAEGWGEICAYFATFEAGIILILVIRAGLEAAFIYSGLAGLNLLAFGAGSWGVESFIKGGRSVTPAVFLLLGGLLGVAGLPLTPGFSATALALAHLGGRESLLVLGGRLGIMAGGLKLLRPLVPAFRSDPFFNSFRAAILALMAVIFIVLSFAIGL